jgi:DNA polymerase III delta prime subunit
MKNHHKLLNEKYRPQILENFVGSDVLKSQLQEFINQNNITNMLFFGPAGSGKTTLCKLLVKNIDCDYLMINASDERGIETIRDKVQNFASVMSFKPLKVVILDECLEENTLVTILRKGEIKFIPIKDLDENNDLVKSYNIEKSRIEWKPFYLWDKGEQDLYEIEFENEEIIQCTGDHKWYVKDNNGNLQIKKTTELEDYMEIFNPKV